MPKNEMVAVLDFGGQYKELIARAVRGQSVYSEIIPGDIAAARLKELSPIGIILTGGPASDGGSTAASRAAAALASTMFQLRSIAIPG